jgi:hypothetical protein
MEERRLDAGYLSTSETFEHIVFKDGQRSFAVLKHSAGGDFKILFPSSKKSVARNKNICYKLSIDVTTVH